VFHIVGSCAIEIVLIFGAANATPKRQQPLELFQYDQIERALAGESCNIHTKDSSSNF